MLTPFDPTCGQPKFYAVMVIAGWKKSDLRRAKIEQLRADFTSGSVQPSPRSTFSGRSIAIEITSSLRASILCLSMQRPSGTSRVKNRPKVILRRYSKRALFQLRNNGQACTIEAVYWEVRNRAGTSHEL